MPNPVVHFEIITKEPESLAAFFRDAFEWSIDTQHPLAGAGGVPNYFLALPNGDQPPKAGINGGIGGVPEGYEGHATFYVAVDDVAATLDRVERLGGRRMMGPERVPGGPLIALFTDPQGHVIGLVKNET
jgi:predicted enzyme related to lactoylglutathione lyase